MGRWVGVAIGVLVLLAGAAAAPNTIVLSTGLAATSPQDQVIALVNVERSKIGLSPVYYNSALATSAGNYSTYMATANFFSHVGPDGSTLATRAEAAGYTGWHWLGENIAGGQTSAQQVMSGWMASPSHRANILSASAKEIGVGFATGGAWRYYWTQEFGARFGFVPPTPTVVPTPSPTRVLPYKAKVGSVVRE